MKALTFAILALLVVALMPVPAVSQTASPTVSVTYQSLPISGTSAGVRADAGATWDASIRKYSVPIALYQYDSVQVIFMFPDSVNMVAKWQYGWDNTFSSPTDSSTSIMQTDSLLSATAIYQQYSCAYALGGTPGPIGRLVYDFKATKNHAPAYDATTNFKVWIKGFLRVK